MQCSCAMCPDPTQPVTKVKLRLTGNELRRRRRNKGQRLSGFAYCCGPTVPSQLVIADELTRITASAKEQK